MFKNKIVVGLFITVVIIFLGILGLRLVPDVTTNVQKNLITIKSLAFNPKDLTIKVGEKVTWINQDFVPHNVVSDSFKSPVMMRGGTFEYTFKVKGIFEYICSIHPFMKAKIVVE